MKSLVYLFVIFIAVVSFRATGAGLSDRVALSGFGRLVAGYLDDETVTFEGYDDSVNINNQSLLAVQADVRLTDTLSLTTQALAHSSAERSSGLEWLYLTYEPSLHWQLKAGKMRTPFFNYSDVIDVGFAYPWVTPPQQLYSAFLFSHYEGATVVRRDNFGTWQSTVEAYYGRFDDATYFQEQRFPSVVTGMHGLVITLDYDLNWRFRAGYSGGDAKVELGEMGAFVDALNMFGFSQSAATLNASGEIDVYQLGINYDDFFYSAGWEWISIRSDLPLGKNINSYYLTMGLNFQPLSLHLTYANSSDTRLTAAQEIPTGVSPELDGLSAAYNGIVTSLQTAELESTTLTARYDVNVNTALKAEITYYTGAEGINSFALVAPSADFNRHATLYQISVEFVF